MTQQTDRLAAALADRYTIERELGAGGMATVYLAHDLKHDRDVAIKVLHPDLGAALGAERFLTEIKTTARLQHPHILPLLDSGDAGGLLYYVMPLATGETLRERLARDQQLPVDDAIAFAREVADALGYAHGLGIVHRDIKPENILLQNGHALVADFGIALAVTNAGGPRMTQTGLSLGTPSYMSPEQAMGERTIDARSDIYALGAVTYEMLVGEPPFTGATMQAIVAKVVNAEPQRPSLVRKSLSPGVEYAVLKALAKLPADRYATATAFADALRDGPTQFTSTSSVSAPFKRAGMDWRIALAAGVMLGAMAMFVVARTRMTSADSGGLVRNTQVTFSGNVALPALSPGGDVLAYAQGTCEQEAHTAFPSSEHSIGNEVPCKASLVVQDSGATAPVRVLSDVLSISAVRFSADGATLVIRARLDSARDGVFAIPRLGGVVRALGPPGVFDVHPSGDTIVILPYTRERETASFARVVVASTGAVVDSIRLHATSVKGMAWSPDARYIALVQEEWVRIIGRDGREIDSVRAGPRSTIRWNVDGTSVLIFQFAPARDDDFIRIAVGRDGHLSRTPVVIIPRMQTLYRGDFDIARRTGRLAMINGNATQDVWGFALPGADGHEPPRQLTRGTTWYGLPTISPDGRTIYHVRGDALGDNLYRLSRTQAEPVDEALSATPGAGSLAMTTVSADGRRVGYRKSNRDTVVTYEADVVSGRSRASIKGLDYQLAVIGPSGWVGRLDTGRGIVVFDSLNARPRTIAAPDSIVLATFALSSDGKQLAIVAAIGNASVIGVVDLAGAWNFRPLVRLPASSAWAQVSWNSDGGIYFAGWQRGASAPLLYRVPTSGGVAVTVMSLPPHCWIGSVVVALASKYGVCQTYDVRGDVYLSSIPGITR